jgi:hypothetical protein
MGAIVIKADKKSSKILSELAVKLGASVINLEDDQFEDIMLGAAMDSIKTGELTSREEILRKLSTK